MGAWGVGVWQDDVAADVCRGYADARTAGMDVEAALAAVWADPPWPLDDPDDQVATVLALAACGLADGCLPVTLAAAALQCIASGAALERWTAAPAEMLAQRQQVVQQFTDLLRRGSASPAALRAVTEP